MPVPLGKSALLDPRVHIHGFGLTGTLPGDTGAANLVRTCSGCFGEEDKPSRLTSENVPPPRCRARLSPGRNAACVCTLFRACLGVTTDRGRRGSVVTMHSHEHLSCQLPRGLDTTRVGVCLLLPISNLEQLERDHLQCVGTLTNCHRGTRQKKMLHDPSPCFMAKNVCNSRRFALLLW
jgi:hypothetical protein